VNYRATVWLNGQELGNHEGGFTPFAFEVTGKVQAGDNHITVRADNRHSNETLPASDFDWQNYGGITRSIRLISVADTFIRDWFIRLEAGQVRADVFLDGPAMAGQPVEVRFDSLRLSLRGVTDGQGKASQHPAKATLTGLPCAPSPPAGGRFC
jgi:beta-glucuronidase